jgi:putative redox protein
MSEKVEASVRLIDNKVKFSATANDNPEIILDYVPPIGTGKGYMPLQLFLISFSSCAAATVVALLRKFGKHIDGMKVDVSGTRHEQHPTSFDKILLKFEFISDDLTEEDAQNAIAKSEEKYCPVWTMIKGNVEVDTEIVIVRNS